MEKWISIVENKQYTAFPSDRLTYFQEDGTRIELNLPELRAYTFLKVVHKIYKPKYRFFGRFTVYASMDKKHWKKMIDHIILRR